jgi:hypothetical protein
MNLIDKYCNNIAYLIYYRNYFLKRVGLMSKLKFFILLLVSSYTFAEETRHANAHVHGLNNVTMILSQKEVAISYEMPIAQLYDDEHDDHDDHDEHDDDKHDDEHDDEHDDDKHDDENDEHDEHEEDDVYKEITKESLEEFKNYSLLFDLPFSAKCALSSFESEFHKVSTEGDHKDIELAYEFICEEPSLLNGLRFSAFDRFDDLETINFDAVINNKGFTKSFDSLDNMITF